MKIMKKPLFKSNILRNAAFILILLLTCILSIHPANTAYSDWRDAIESETPYAVDGRILTKDKTDDTSDWIEIARNGRYSLIVRKNYLNIYNSATHKDKPDWQYIPYGSSTNNYTNSSVRRDINYWFNTSGTGVDKLPANARLRSFTMQNTAYYYYGSTSAPASLLDGFSKPTSYMVGIGDDIAFALSYGEAANFISKMYYMSNTNKTSSSIAINNYNKIVIPTSSNYGMWLRSPGNQAGAAAAMTNGGRVFQFLLNNPTERGMVYPALWVDSDIFGTAPKNENIDLVGPYAVDGRILEPIEVGDSVPWVEIAHMKDGSGKVMYSLIVRSKFINTYASHTDEWNWQCFDFNGASGNPQDYNVSTTRNFINNWFDRRTVGAADALGADARLRKHVVYSYDATRTKIGSSCSYVSLTDGFSTPTMYNKGVGDDVAFALSYGEAANFLSNGYFSRSTNPNSNSSSPIAIANFAKLDVPRSGIYGIWLRSPGDVANTAAAIDNGGDTIRGRVFQFFTSRFDSVNSVKYIEFGFTYPAVWVDQSIFDRATVTYHANGGIGQNIEDKVPYNGSYTILGNTFTRPNYAFRTWQDSSGKEYSPNEKIIITESLDLYAQWDYSPGLLSVSYDPNGGKGKIVVDEVIFNTEYTIRDNPGFTFDNYEFNGWNTWANGLGDLYLDGDRMQVTDNITLYAQWEPMSFTVTYHPNGGVGGNVTEKVKYDEYYTIQAQKFTRAGYSFNGWMDGRGESYSIGKVIRITGNLDLYAQWEPNPLTVTYHSNDDSYQTVKDNTVYDKSYAIRGPLFIWTGYSFNGWNTQADGKGDSYATDRIIKMTGDLNLYAQWSKASVAIHYDPNGGSGEPVTDYTSIGSKYEIKNDKDLGYKRTYFTFLHWNTKADNSGTEYKIDIDNNDNNYIEITSDEPIFLYAIWIPVI
jgi:uncharacterized repeat protein (TIGR02543 family)